MKKALSIFTALFMLLTCMVTPNMTAYAANISLSVSASSVQIGDSVKVTVTIPSNVSGPIDISLSNDILTFSSSTAKEIGVNGRYISVSMGKYGLEGTNTVTLTFKAKTSGSVTVSASHGDIYDNDSFDPVQLGSASTTITVANKIVEPEPEKSGDNSLASLKLSKGTLSPKFKYSTTKYTATVDYDVTKVVVSAKTSNAKATIESITGNGTVNLKVGQNTIEIIVKAENGVKAKYTIVVTRKEKPASEAPQPTESESDSQSESTTPPPVNEALQWNGEQLYVPTKIPTETVPKDFEATSLVVNGQQMQGLSFTKADLKVLYLNNTNGAGSLYVYDEEQQSIYPFIKISSEQSYVMVLVPNEEKDPAPAGFESCTFSIEGKGVVNAYQLKDKAEEETITSWNPFSPETFYAAPAKASEFYLIYCMNNNGEKGWYLYDSVEETFQRYLAVENSIQVGGDVTNDTEDDTQNDSSDNATDEIAKLEKELKTAKMTQYIAMGVAVVLTIIVIVLIVLLVMKKRNQEDDFFDGYEDEEDYDDEEDEDDEIEVEFYNMEERIVNQTVESEKITSVEDDADDLEFIDFE